MGEASPAGPLVLRPDVIPDVHRDDRDVMVFVDDDVEAVGERSFGEGEREGVHSGHPTLYQSHYQPPYRPPALDRPKSTLTDQSSRV